MPPAGGGVLILSSRMSYELGQKAARAKILFILAVPVG
jgi:formate dehydrogenase assembly factor FdhD